MAVVTRLGNTVTNRDAVPAVINDGRLEGSNEKIAKAFITTVAGDSIASIYKMIALPSTAIVHQILVSCAAMTAGAGDLGVYRNSAAGGAVVSAAFFAAAVSFIAALNHNDAMTQTTNTLDKRAQPLWQAAGLAADPGQTLDVNFTLTTAITAGGLLEVVVKYTDHSA